MFVQGQRVIVSDLLQTIFVRPFSHKSQRHGDKHDAKTWREKRIDSLNTVSIPWVRRGADGSDKKVCAGICFAKTLYADENFVGLIKIM